MLLSASITAVDHNFDLIGRSILASWKLILLLVLGLVSSYYLVAVIAFQPLIERFYFWITPATFMIECFHNIQLSHVVLMVVGHLTVLFFFWDPNKALMFQVCTKKHLYYILGIFIRALMLLTDIYYKVSKIFADLTGYLFNNMAIDNRICT